MSNKVLMSIVGGLFAVLIIVIGTVGTLVSNKIDLDHQEIMLLRAGQAEIMKVVLKVPDQIEDLEDDLAEHEREGHR